jgi:hypothetical protein
MKLMRLKITILTSWLVLIFIINRLIEPMAISNAAIAFLFVIVFTMPLIPRMPAWLKWVITILPIASLLVTKIDTGMLSGVLGFYMALIDIAVVTFTVILTNWINASLHEFESSVAQVTLGENQKKVEKETTGMGILYREVRCARNHQRPLALISIGIEEQSIDVAVKKMVEEIQLTLVKEYKLQQLSKILSEQLEDCAIVVKEADRFLAVLPETDPDELPIVLDRLRQNAISRVHIELKIGAATLPNDSYTFEGLLDKATQSMASDQEIQTYVVLDKQPIEQ